MNSGASPKQNLLPSCKEDLQKYTRVIKRPMNSGTCVMRISRDGGKAITTISFRKWSPTYSVGHQSSAIKEGMDYSLSNKSPCLVKSTFPGTDIKLTPSD